MNDSPRPERSSGPVPEPPPHQLPPPPPPDDEDGDAGVGNGGGAPGAGAVPPDFDLRADADNAVADPLRPPPPAETGIHEAIGSQPGHRRPLPPPPSVPEAVATTPGPTLASAGGAADATDGFGPTDGSDQPAPFPPHQETGLFRMADDRPLIQMIDLTVEVKGRTLIRNANVGIGHGEVVLLVGGSGTGKSVLSKIMLGLITRDTPGFRITGKLLVHGRDILGGARRECKRFGIVFQDYALFDELGADDNLDFAFDHSLVRWNQHERDRRLQRLSETLSLNLDTPISRSSGGERRRLAIARTLAYDPEIVLYDEPTTGLDPLNSERVAQLIGASARTFGKTAFVITHDYEYLRGVADRVLLLDPETRELKELDKDAATAAFVRDRLVALAPPVTKLEPLAVQGAKGLASFFIATSRVLEAAVATPLRTLLWPFGIGLAVVGAIVLGGAVLVGSAEVASQPQVGSWLFGVFALGALLFVAARFRHSRRQGTVAVLWLAVMTAVAALLHTPIAFLFGWSRAPGMAETDVVRAGAPIATMFLMIAVPALYALGHLVRARHAVLVLTIAGALQMSLLCVTGGIQQFGELDGETKTRKDRRDALQTQVTSLEQRVTSLQQSVAAGSASEESLVRRQAELSGARQKLREAESEYGWTPVLETIRIDVPSFSGGPVKLVPFLSPWLILLTLGVGYLVAGGMATVRMARQRWGGLYFWHYMKLVAFGTSVPYLAAAGFITGFVATFFIYRYFPFRDYTEPLIVDDILRAVGFILWRVLIPLVATVLIAARCGAAVAADIGNRVYTHQADALKTFNVKPQTYWAQNVMWAFLIGGPLLVGLAFLASAVASLMAFLITHPPPGPHSSVSFWWLHFLDEIKGTHAWWPKDFEWLLAKILICSAGTAAISTGLAMRRKESAVSVSRAITQTILWSTLFVLLTHLAFAFFEFRELKPPSR